ncbi:unnamed protein product [Closterium sp. Naga37s-1]|nr:unnamed protein product [Closterium sp. Naga37s-1]
MRHRSSPAPACPRPILTPLSPPAAQTPPPERSPPSVRTLVAPPPTTMPACFCVCAIVEGVGREAGKMEVAAQGGGYGGPCPAPFYLCCPVVPVLPRSACVVPFSPCPAPFSPCPAPFSPCCPVQPASCPVLPVLPRSTRAAPFCPFVPYPCCPYPFVPHPCYQFSLVPHPVCAAWSRAARHPRAARAVQHLVATRTCYLYPYSSHTVHLLRGVQLQPSTCSTAVVQMLLGGCCLSASEGAPCWCSDTL